MQPTPPSPRGRRGRRAMVAVAALAALALSVRLVGVAPRAATAAAPPEVKPQAGPATKSLRRIMLHELSPEFGALCALQRQGASAVGEMSGPAERLSQAARSIARFAGTEFSGEESAVFAKMSGQLASAADRLVEAVGSRRTDAIASALDHLDMTCQSCHSVLQPDLVAAEGSAPPEAGRR